MIVIIIVASALVGVFVHPLVEPWLIRHDAWDRLLDEWDREFEPWEAP